MFGHSILSSIEREYSNIFIFLNIFRFLFTVYSFCIVDSGNFVYQFRSASVDSFLLFKVKELSVLQLIAHFYYPTEFSI